MIRHIVCFKFKPDITEEEKAALVQATRELPKAISVAKSWQDGFNLGPRDKTYDYGITCEFDDWDAFNTYIDHPAHQAFVENYVKKLVPTRAVIDFEV